MPTVKKSKTSVKQPAKKLAKKPIKKVVKKISQAEILGAESEGPLQLILQKVSDDASAKIDDLRKKFDRVDAETKKKIVTGLSVVAAALVVLAGVSKAKSNKRKKSLNK